MANCLSYSDLDCMVRKKCKGFLGKVEDFKDSVESNSFLFLFLCFMYHSL